MATDQERALALIIRALDEIGVPSLVCGSVASSIHGIPRMTQDVGIVVAMEARHVEPFAAAIRGAFYVDEATVHDAVTRRRCFNAIHIETVTKIDVFVRDASDWAAAEWSRRVRARVTDAPDSPEVNVSSAEDTLLHKLERYRLGGCISERQWRDVLGILQVRGTELDRAYLAERAGRLELGALLHRAMQESGVE